MMKKLLFLVLAMSMFISCGSKQDKIERYMEDGVEIIINHKEPHKIKGELSTLHLEEEFRIDTEKDEVARVGLADIYRFDVDDLQSRLPGAVSLHEIGIVDSIKMMSLMGKRPKTVTVIGIEPGTIDFGIELSPELSSRLPEIIEIVLNEIEDKNISMEVAR